MARGDDDFPEAKGAAIALVSRNGLQLNNVLNGLRDADVVLAALASDREAIYCVYDKAMYDDPRLVAALQKPGTDESARTSDDIIGKRVARWVTRHYPDTAAAKSLSSSAALAQ